MNGKAIRPICWSLALLGWHGLAGAQERFELRVPGAAEQSRALLRGSTLEITHQNQTHAYQRDAQFDSAGFLGFVNRPLGQVIRWPQGGSGAMQIGTLIGTTANFRPSQMSVRPLAGPAGPRPGLDAQRYYRLTNGFLGPDHALDADQRGTVAMGLRGDFDSQAWQLIWQGNDTYRLTTAQLGPAWSLVVDPRTRAPRLERSAPNSRQQLWRVTPVQGDRFVLTNEALGPRWSLEAAGANLPTMARSDRFAGQYWRMAPIRPIPTAPRVPARRLFSRQLVPAEPLPPVEIGFSNTQEDELWVLVTDLRNPLASQRLKIPAGGIEKVQLDRDAGGRFVERWEVRQPDGSFVVEEIVSAVPPRPFYDVSVYQLVIQSIAIDRTQRGRGRIEDIQRSPQSIGAFPVPAGAALRGGTTDVYAAAKRHRNPGGVRRIDPKEWQAPSQEKEDPIKALLRRRERAATP